MPGHAQYTLGPVPCIGNVDNARVRYHQMASYVSLLLCSMPGHPQYTLGPVTCIDNVVDNARVGYHQMALYFLN